MIIYLQLSISYIEFVLFFFNITTFCLLRKIFFVLGGIAERFVASVYLLIRYPFYPTDADALPKHRNNYNTYPDLNNIIMYETPIK